MREESQAKLLELKRETFLEWYEPSSEALRIQEQERMNELRLFQWAQKKARLGSRFYAGDNLVGNRIL